MDDSRKLTRRRGRRKIAGERTVVQAPADEIARYAEAGAELLRRVAGLEWHQCLVTDESSLWDFYTGGEGREVVLARVGEDYDVDVSDITSGNLVSILERLSGARPN